MICVQCTLYIYGMTYYSIYAIRCATGEAWPNIMLACAEVDHHNYMLIIVIVIVIKICVIS